MTSVSKKYRQFFRFVLVGLLSTLLNFMFYQLLNYFNIQIELSAVIAYIIGLICSFIFGKTWVFENNSDKIKKQFFKFILIYMTSLILYTLIISYFNDDYGKTYSWLFAISISTLINFFGSKYAVFK